jgi:hypothetical protein
MNEHRRQILEMLAAGKINADEAERLIAALEPEPEAAAQADSSRAESTTTVKPAKGKAKYLRVQVEADESMTGMKGPTTVNVRVPMQLLRAGVRLGSLIPPQAQEQVNQAFSRHGVPLNVSQIKPENLDELIDHLEDLTVDVDGKEGNKTKVRVFCE